MAYSNVVEAKAADTAAGVGPYTTSSSIERRRLGISIAAAGAIATSHAYNVRYAILAFPAFVALVAAGIESFPTRRLRLMRFPGRGRPDDFPAPAPAVHASTGEPAEQLEAALRRLGGTEGSYWLLLSRTFHGDKRGELTKFSDRHFERELEFTSPGVVLVRYTAGSRTLP